MSKQCWMVPQVNNPLRKIRVVLPVCEKDRLLMFCNLDWQEELDGRKDYDCVLAIDGGMHPDHIRDLEMLAWRTFSGVEVFVYPAAPNPVWPNGPNWAFQQTARHMQRAGRPWFWMESDCVPVQYGWLDILNQEYAACRKPIMGSIVRGMGHCNGTAIYPPDFPNLSRRAMECTDSAWDGDMKHETIRLTYDASRIMCHVWGIKNGRAQPFGGDPAHFGTWREVQRWVCPGAVTFHRCKDNSLIDRLREKHRAEAATWLDDTGTL